jgi:phosphoribosyl-ATP pyrophosphohydrolase/phosphoribosyl-AMP cyclohydrolase
MTSVPIDIESLDFAKGGGIVTVVTQDAATGEVLMVAAADRDAMERTVATGEMHYRSRTRGLWHKGETSGNIQEVVSLTADCDRDAVLALVKQRGAACHTGATSCFDGTGTAAANALGALDALIARRAATQGDARGYTRRLLDDRNLRLKKLGEECSELVVALADGERERVAEEAADLFYHLLVALRAAGLALGDVLEVLAARRNAVAATDHPASRG